MEKTREKRQKILLCIFVILIFLLGMRVFYIQIICHDELSVLAESQYEVFVEGLDTRGMILDRNSMPLTGNTAQYYYFIKWEFADDYMKSLIDRIDGKQIASSESQYYVYRTEKYNKYITDTLKNDYNAYVLKNDSRYCDEQMACHLIGYLNENEKTGVSGLELLCQEQLSATNDSLCLWADASGNLIMGTHPYKHVEDSTYGTVIEGRKNVVTTIDRRIQFVAEKALNEQEQSGAVVIMDGDNGEILAWASSPAFNPNSIEDYLNGGDDCLINKVCQASYPPGSVFKIVTALAGIECGINPAESFLCERKIEIEGITIGCMAGPEEGHGYVNMEKAMAVSCNCYFAKIGEEIGYEKVLEMAKSMGFGSKTMEWFPEEIGGKIPSNEESGPWDTSNIAIGQGMILSTPLQICRMTAVIASGGYLISPKILMSEETKKEKIVSEESTAVVESGMKKVMLDGTCKGEWKLDIYGKTGTAETGSSENNSNICWFTGYCRKDKNYVITIMLEDGTTGAYETIPVLEKITNLLEKI